MHVALLGLVIGLFASTQDEEKKAKLGEVIPKFTLKSVDEEGKPLNLKDYRKSDTEGGKPVVIVFWSYRCPSGRRAMERLGQLAAKCEKAGVPFVAICAYGESEIGLRRYRKRNGIKYPLYYDANNYVAAKMFNPGVVTASYVLNRVGEMVYKGTDQDAWKAVQALLDGKPVDFKFKRARG